MPVEKLEKLLAGELSALDRSGARKGPETVFTGIVPAAGGRGPRYLLAGEGDKPFLRMNSNGYLGLATSDAVRAAEALAVESYGAGPGAVRFISGTWSAHIELEQTLARFHKREAAMIFSSAYGAMMGVMAPLISSETAVISDALNHNCIINAVRLAQPKEKHIYKHLDLNDLEAKLKAASRNCRRAIVITDGVFSMRGDCAPLKEVVALARAHDAAFAENVMVVVDDSHGVGAFGASGRGTEEHTGAAPADLLIATLGKAFGVNGGYAVARAAIVDYLRETSPFYVYSNPITPGEAAAAVKAVEIVDSAEGARKLGHLREMTARFSAGLEEIGLETIPGDHPIVPLMVRDTAQTRALVAHLRDHGILATGLGYPVVPKGDEEIRFQISADHTPRDIDEALAVLAAAPVAP